MSYCPNCGYNISGGRYDALKEECPMETRCSWMVYGLDGKKWTSSHGVIIDRHPSGWCNGECCR